jgi:hypothetical protein
MIRDAEKSPFHGDAEFVANLDDILRRLPSLEELVREAKRALNEQIPKIISVRCKKLTNIALELQERKCTAQVKIEAGDRCEGSAKRFTERFIRALNASSHKYQILVRSARYVYC